MEAAALQVFTPIRNTCMTALQPETKEQRHKETNQAYLPAMLYS